MSDILDFLRQQMLELGLLLIGGIITAYVVPWLREKKLIAFADRLDLILSRVLVGAMNRVPGVTPGLPVPAEKVTQVIAEAAKELPKTAPDLAAKIGDKLPSLVVNRITVEEAQ